MGTGRSGSTILGVALGNCADVFYAGELDAWLRMSGVSPHGGAERARFWKTVYDEVGGDDLFGDRAWRCLEHSLSLLRIWNWPARHRLRRRYRGVAEQLCRAVARTADTTHVVDTSHYPLRARELKSIGGIDLYLIYLVRDPRKIVAAFKRRDAGSTKSTLGTNAYLSLTYLLSSWAFLRHRRDRRLLLRYEDFVADPEGVLGQILDWMGLSATPPDLTALNSGMAFHGNRLLGSEVVALRGDAASPSRGSGGSYITKLIQLPWTILLARLHPSVALSTSDDDAPPC